MYLKFIFILSILLLSYGCTPMIYPPGKQVNVGQILDDKFITADGVILPLKQWYPQKSETKAVLVALHGFNDYSNFFQQPGQYFEQQGIISYAYDQRGFGGSPQRGLWSGVDAYIQDLDLFIHLIKQKHPALPVFLLGESMGGAVVLLTIAQYNQPLADGIILAAPAIWARETMPWYQRLLLWTVSHTLPWLTLTGESLDVKASDNIEMLIALGKDPMVIKETRVETLYGLANLMDAAWHQTNGIQTKTLILYGEKDEIIPMQPTYEFLHLFMKAKPENKKTAFYQQGYHLLLRDLQAKIIWNDVSAWIKSACAPLPSGADSRARQILSENPMSSD